MRIFDKIHLSLLYYIGPIVAGPNCMGTVHPRSGGPGLVAMNYCYILTSLKDNSYYIGSTSNIEIRLHHHNTGKSKYTRTKMPWKLIYFEEFDSLSSAKKREYQIKSWHSRYSIEKLILRKAPSSSG